jgi:hypothetical protein
MLQSLATVKTVVVLQSNYVPWRGYFSLLAAAQECVIYDSCQYTKNDWRNRNRVLLADGRRWLTIPVETAGRFGQSIYEVGISDPEWSNRHLTIIKQALGDAPQFATLEKSLFPVFERCSKMSKLHDVNVELLRTCAALAGIATRITLDSEYRLADESPTARVAELVEQAGGSRYVTGPAGLNYLDLAEFEARGIRVDVIDYGSLKPYAQLHSGFEPGVTVLDYFANVTPDDYDFDASTNLVSGES